MATKDEYRINKDISTRKNAVSSSTMNDPEMLANLAAEEARRKAYIETLKLAYEEQIEHLKAECADQVKSMQETINSAEKAKEAACADVRAQGLAASNEVFEKLTAEKTILETALKKALSDKYDEVQAATKTSLDLIEKINMNKAAHALSEECLKKKLESGPNSWAEITFRCKGFKDRKLVRRLSSTVEEARIELRKTIQKSVFSHTCTLRLHGKELSVPTKSLRVLGVKDGDVIEYEVEARAFSSK